MFKSNISERRKIMGILDRFRSQPAPPAAKAVRDYENIITLTYQHSEHFRGFKRIHLSTYGFQPVQDGIRSIIGSPIAVVELQLIRDNASFTEPIRVLKVFADGVHIGTYFENSPNQYLDMLLDNQIDKVHIELEDAGDRYNSKLFVHID